MSDVAVRRPWYLDRFGPLALFGVAYVVVFAVRSISTLVAEDPTWGAPGTGWRSVWQLLMVAIIVTGIAAPRFLFAAVAVVGSVYVLATISELFNGSALIELIPVDARDRWVHPLVAVLAGLALIAHGILARRARHLSS